jgi:hypothetical protein
MIHAPVPHAADEPQVVEQQKRALHRDADARSASVAPPAGGSRQPHTAEDIHKIQRGIRPDDGLETTRFLWLRALSWSRIALRESSPGASPARNGERSVDRAPRHALHTDLS